MKWTVGGVNITQFSCYLYTQGKHKLRKRLGRMPRFLANCFIQLDYKQFMKISHETIAPWPLFHYTFIMGANGNRTSRQYLILGISITCSEETNSL